MKHMIFAERENHSFSISLAVKSYDVYIKLRIFIQNYD